MLKWTSSRNHCSIVADKRAPQSVMKYVHYIWAYPHVQALHWLSLSMKCHFTYCVTEKTITVHLFSSAEFLLNKICFWMSTNILMLTSWKTDFLFFYVFLNKLGLLKLTTLLSLYNLASVYLLLIQPST